MSQLPGRSAWDSLLIGFCQKYGLVRPHEVRDHMVHRNLRNN